MMLLIGIFVCFFLSGLAALIYEVVWMRMLTQVFGSTAYAVATVLAAFMAGLALGSYLFGRIVDRERNYLLLYGLLELGIGIYGLLAPVIFKLAQRVYVTFFWLQDLNPAIFNLLLLSLSFLLLAFPTLLMGATLPVLSRFLIRRLSQVGKRIGDLYGTNTMGAVLGCALAGYYLIPTLGIRWTLYSAAAINLAVALVILVADWARKKLAEETAPAAPPEAAKATASGDSHPEKGRGPLGEKPGGGLAAIRGTLRPWLGQLLLAAIALSGFAAMVYENAWTHALTLVIGGSVYSFTTMLATFLTGLAIGGYLYARLFGEREVPVTAFGLLELGVGITALATIPLFEKLPLIFLRLHQGFGDSFALFLAMQSLIAAAVMFLPTVLLGMTFPMVVRLFTQSLYRVGKSVGTTYASNTMGAILGAFAGGFVLIPLFGMQNSILVGSFLNLAVGWVLVIADPKPGRARRLVLGGAVTAMLAVLALRIPSWDPSILTSGVTIYAQSYRSLPTDSLRLEEMRKDEILYYREGLNATISVHRPSKDYLYLKTNGKIDGSHGDALTMLMTGYLPMLLLSEPERAAVIGLGTGMTVKAVGAFPTVKQIEVMEIEPAMVQAAAFFKDKNGDILRDPRVRIIATDGRNYMMAAPHLYDLIISEPSNPWIAGVASLFTSDFYAVTKGKLKPDGIFAQWIHNYSMSPDDFRMVLRTFGEAFPHVSVWNLQESDFLLIGSSNELEFDYPRLKKIFSEITTLREDFVELGLSDPYAVLGFYRMGKKELLAFAEGADLNTDDNAALEFSAPRSLGKDTAELNRNLIEPFLASAPWKPNNRWVSPGRQHYHVAQAYSASGWYNRALREIDQALELEPKNAQYHLLRGQILAAMEEIQEAFRATLKALEYGRDNIREILALTEEFYTLQASLIYSRVMRLRPHELLPHLGLGSIALYRGELHEAEKWLRGAAKLQPEHPAVLLALGRLESAKGNYGQAAKLLEESRRKGEDSSTLYGALGDAYSRRDQWDKAAEAYGLALRRQRKNPHWRLSLAVALERMGKVREAEKRYREVLALNPSEAEAWKGLRGLGKRY